MSIMDRGQIGRRGRGGKEWLWDYFEVTVSRNRDGKQRPTTAVCTLCRSTVSPKIERIREHFNRSHADRLDDPRLESVVIESSDSSARESSDYDMEILRKELNLRKEAVDGSGSDLQEVDNAFTEKEWVLKYYSQSQLDLDVIVGHEIEDQMKCRFCQVTLNSTDTKALINHLFEVHAVDGLSEEQEIVDITPPPRRSSTHSPEAASLSSARRPKASVWTQFQECAVEGPDGITKVPKVRCKVCQLIVSPKVERLRRHMLENHAELADKETEERFLASKEATKLLIGRGDLDQISKSTKITPPPAVAKSLSELSMKKDPDGKRALIWTYFQLIYSHNALESSKVIGAQCKICETLVSPKIERLRKHFVNHHTDILVGSEDFDVQAVLDEEVSKADTTLKTELLQANADLEWIRKYFDFHESQSQCRLCLGMFEPQMESLYEHLQVSHEGILEFCDTLPTPHFKEEETREGEIEPIETTAEFEWEDGDDLTDVALNKSPESRCLLCEHSLSLGQVSNSLLKWDRNCCQSLCQLFSLDESYRHYFETGKYCQSCQELLRNIDFTQRALNRFRTLLSTYRHTYENLLHKTYQVHLRNSEVGGQPSTERLHKGIFKLKRQTSLKRKVKTVVQKRHLKRPRSTARIKEVAEKKIIAVEYKSKYGRTCTSLTSDLRDHGDEDDVDWMNSDDDRKPDRRASRRGTFARKPKPRSTTDEVAKPRTKFICEISGCNFSSYQKSWLEVHVRSRHDHDESPYHCDCGEKFGNMTSYGLHQRKHIKDKRKEIVCPTCKEPFPDKSALQEHRAEEHKKQPKPKAMEPQRCSFCSLVISEGQVLSEHEKLHEVKVISKVPYDCVLCDAPGFTNTLTLQLHVKAVHNAALSGPKCDKCDKIFKSVKILKRHSKRAHLDDPPKPLWQCAECGHISPDRSAYRYHFKEHAKPRPFLCAECGMTFKSKSNLKIHTMLHTGERPWQCKLCPKGFNQSSKLRAHEETHVETKTYVCDKCGKAFRTARNIYQHQKFHCHNPDEPLKSHDGSITVAKKRRMTPAGFSGHLHESEGEGSNTSLTSIPAPLVPVIPDDGQIQGQFDPRHQLTTLPVYITPGSSSMDEILTIDTRSSGIPFVASTHSGHHVPTGYNVPIWIAHGQQSLHMESIHPTGRM